MSPEYYTEQHIKGLFERVEALEERLVTRQEKAVYAAFSQVMRDAEARQRGENIDGSPRRETKPALPEHVDGVFVNEPSFNTKYHLITSNYGVRCDTWESFEFDKNSFAAGNVYVTEEAAQWHVERRKVEIELLRAGVRCYQIYHYQMGCHTPDDWEVLLEAVDENRLKYLLPWTGDER